MRGDYMVISVEEKLMYEVIKHYTLYSISMPEQGRSSKTGKPNLS